MKAHYNADSTWPDFRGIFVYVKMGVNSENWQLAKLNKPASKS
jgi:hypothetical protein